MKQEKYEAPQVEIIEVEVEKGFVMTGGGNEGFNSGTGGPDDDIVF